MSRPSDTIYSHRYIVAKVVPAPELPKGEKVQFEAQKAGRQTSIPYTAYQRLAHAKRKPFQDLIAMDYKALVSKVSFILFSMKS